MTQSTKSGEPVLTLAEIETFDPQAPAGREERRAWCPLCGESKPKDASHRSLCFNARSGLWNCKRCGAKGLFREFWPEQVSASTQDRRNRAQSALKRAFEIESTVVAHKAPIAPENAVKIHKPEIAEWRAIYQGSQSLVDTPGEEYLKGRGIAAPVAVHAGVLLSRAWHRRATLVFPFQNQSGEVVAIAGRALKNGGMDKPAAGPKKEGAFFAPSGRFAPLDDAVPTIVICEAPLDALSMAVAGFPALALGGTSPPQWLARACAFRRVALALDADAPGDKAAEKIGATLQSFGARCERLRPENANDWNEFLQLQGAQILADHLAVRLL